MWAVSSPTNVRFCEEKILVKKFAGGLALVIGLLLSLSACGNEATPTSQPATAAPTANRVATTVASATTAAAVSTTAAASNDGAISAVAVTVAATTARSTENPFIATITASSNPALVIPPSPTADASPTALPPTAIAATDLKLYSGLKPLDLGVFGTQISSNLVQASSGARNSFYSTSDTFDKLLAYYNTEAPRAGYSKATEQDLPDSAGLTGKLLVYNKGTGATANVVVLIVLGPLDEETIEVLSSASKDAASLKPKDNMVIIVSGLSGAYLSDLQRSLQSAGSADPTPTPTPTR